MGYGIIDDFIGFAAVNVHKDSDKVVAPKLKLVGGTILHRDQSLSFLVRMYTVGPPPQSGRVGFWAATWTRHFLGAWHDSPISDKVDSDQGYRQQVKLGHLIDFCVY
jgi:hypothetical protein